jgi:subtilisin family serine protease
LMDKGIVRNPKVMGQLIGIPPVSIQADLSGVMDKLVGNLEQDSGHGTFIAGLVRQACPDAKLLGVRIFHDNGVVAEGELLRTLNLMVLWQMLALNGVKGYEPVDVLSLSLGYFHEQPEDATFDALLLGPLAALGRLGVAVVVSAGNESTSRPGYPAAFAPYEVNGQPAGVPDDTDRVPVSTVGAKNPDGTIALFSNDGPWVKYLRPGAALVSTFPITYNASALPSNAVLTANGETRAGLDPDNFAAGFAVWSGTSFAAPYFAGQLAEIILKRYQAGDDSADPKKSVPRLRKLLAAIPVRPT